MLPCSSVVIAGSNGKFVSLVLACRIGEQDYPGAFLGGPAESANTGLADGFDEFLVMSLVLPRETAILAEADLSRPDTLVVVSHVEKKSVVGELDHFAFIYHGLGRNASEVPCLSVIVGIDDV